MCIPYGTLSDIADELKNIRRILEEQLTTEDNERIATWIDRGDYAVCSWCAGTSWQQMNGVENVPFKSKYCPNCGTKMRG